MNLKWMAYPVAALLVAACSNDSGGGDSPVQERPSAVASGAAFDGLIRNGDVKIQKMDDSLVASGKTDDKGLYSISLNSIPSQPLKLTIGSGAYIEEFSGKSVDLKNGNNLVAYINYVQGEDVDTSLTLFTTIAAGLAEYRIENGAEPEAAIRESNEILSTIIDIDIESVAPKDITDALNVSPRLESAQIYGYLTASVSAFTSWVSQMNSWEVHETYNSIAFAQLAYQDISYDGKLDGIGKSGAIAMGKIQFSPDTYRNTLALYTLVMANSGNNRLGYGPADLVSHAKKLNDSASPIFADAPIIPLNGDGTVISSVSWTDADAFYGMVDLSISAFDAIGVKSATIKIGNVVISAEDPASPTFAFDSTQFQDGTYDVDIIVTNSADVSTTLKKKVTFANHSTIVVSTNPAEGQAISGEYDFSAVIADPFGVDKVQFLLDGSVALDPVDVKNPSVHVNTRNTIAAEGPHTLKVTATGLSGFEATKTVGFIVDNQAPTISLNLGEGQYVGAVYTLSGVIDDNLILKNASVQIDGNVLLTQTQKGGYSVSFDPQGYSEGRHMIVIDAFDQAGNRFTLSRPFFIDRNPPVVNITTPSGTVATGDLVINFEASDTLGFGSNKIIARLQGYPVDLEAMDNTRRSFTLKPATLFWGEGNSTIEVLVTDGSGKTSSDSIIVNFQHIPTGLHLASTGSIDVQTTGTCNDDGTIYTCTNTSRYNTFQFAFDWASGPQTINSLRFNGVELKNVFFNTAQVPFSPGTYIADPNVGFTLVAVAGGFLCKPVDGPLEYSITDSFGLTNSGTVGNFHWCSR